ncbi:hypothetical protein EVAR_91884_1 [Eumeta japonica]|uniref:Uncharacterized protein n=1 Tax=Eumeta variegata TaxID=151549 RepID=A0A4C1TP28_EUMVA|nr:hypothetical protein EVAR_91884_1 [Eumeta japonica]
MMIAMKIRTKTDSPATPHLQKRTRGVQDRRDILERRRRKRIPRTSHSRDVTNDDQSTRAHVTIRADTSKNRTINDRACGQLYDDEECLDTCHETVEIPTDPSRTTFESQTADETANVARLRKALKKGDAGKRKVIVVFGASADDIPDSLQRYFGRPEILILNELEYIKMPKLAEDGRNERLVSKIVNCVASIKALEKPQYLVLTRAKKEHYLKDCATFASVTHRRRWERAKKAYRCLMSSNTTYRSECRARPCGKDGCKRRITSYCIKIRIDRRDQRAISSINVPKKKECSLKIIPVEISGPLGRLETHALFDEGSTTTLIERDVALKIAPPEKHETLRIEG